MNHLLINKNLRISTQWLIFLGFIMFFLLGQLVFDGMSYMFKTNFLSVEGVTYQFIHYTLHYIQNFGCLLESGLILFTPVLIAMAYATKKVRLPIVALLFVLYLCFFLNWSRLLNAFLSLFSSDITDPWGLMTYTFSSLLKPRSNGRLYPFYPMEWLYVQFSLNFILGMIAAGLLRTKSVLQSIAKPSFRKTLTMLAGIALAIMLVLSVLHSMQVFTTLATERQQRHTETYMKPAEKQYQSSLSDAINQFLRGSTFTERILFIGGEIPLHWFNSIVFLAALLVITRQIRPKHAWIFAGIALLCFSIPYVLLIRPEDYNLSGIATVFDPSITKIPLNTYAIAAYALCGSFLLGAGCLFRCAVKKSVDIADCT